MMSRLEEIKKRYDSAAIVVFEGLGTVSADIQDLNWLIQQVELREEQVQRNLQALGNISVLEGIYDRLEKQNKRYKQALKEIANKSEVDFGNSYSNRVYNHSRKLAEQALKRESE